jgi:multidrug efflux pump subunit AcrA (membrane-fusion protein)
MSRRVLLTATLAAIALAGAACSGSRASAARVADTPTVAVARIDRGDIAQSLTIAAEFRPFQEIEVHAKVAGFLKSISVDVGDRVKAGQLLAVLEIPELQEEIKQDIAAVKRAGEEINRAQADLERAESAHEVAHLASTRLASVMKARPNLVAQQDIDEATGRDRIRQRAAGGGEGRPGPDADHVRLRAHHRAVCRRDHASLCRHGRDDPGGHLLADAGDAHRPAVGERSAAARHSGA